MTFLRIAPIIIAVAGCYEPPPPAPKEPETPPASDKSTQPAVKPLTVPVRPPIQTVPPVQLAQPNTEFDRALARARAEGKLLFVEFSASWCGPCQQMRRTTFSDPTVRANSGNSYRSSSMPTAIRTWSSDFRSRKSPRTSSSGRTLSSSGPGRVTSARPSSCVVGSVTPSVPQLEPGQIAAFAHPLSPGAGWERSRTVDLDALKKILGGASDKFAEARSIRALGKHLDQIKAQEE